MSTFSTAFPRTDNIPTVHLKGVDEQQDVFLYDAPQSVNGEVALYFTLESYYPDFEMGQPVNSEKRFAAVTAYYKTVEQFKEVGMELGEDSSIVKEYNEIRSQQQVFNYFETTRSLLGRLLEGVDAQDVFDDMAPSQDNEEEWADFKAAYFDATGLALIADQIDMPRMSVNNKYFTSFRRSASPEQIRTIDLVEHPEYFDAAGNYRDVA